jgi:WD40 repeat protein/transcriptional regulator with XRE-family HTH domain
MSRLPLREPDFAFGRTMLTLRSATGLTQAEMAGQLGVSRNAVVAWETGASYPHATHLKKFIELGLRDNVFTAGAVAEEIRSLWSAARQKVLFDEVWLQMLLAQDHTAQATQPPAPDTLDMLDRDGITDQVTPTTLRRLDWSDALSVTSFYGREQELALLSDWVVTQRCRLIGVLGLGGIGKSALAVSLMHRVAPHFDVVIWRSLRNLPTSDVLIDDLLQVLATPTVSALPESIDQRVNLLLERLRSSRILLVLDNLDSVLGEGEEAGHMRAGYEEYGHLLRRIAETSHQSCLLFTSREKPGDLVPLEGSRSPVRVLRLARLEAEACDRLLSDANVGGTAPERAQLIEAYTGNPLALKIVAQTIVELFDGEIGLFLEQETLIFGGVRELLAQQFNRLSSLEQSIMFWLAIVREPATLDELIALHATPVARVQLLEGIEALRRRSLVERGQKHGSFTLQSVVLEYATARLIDEVSSEIREGKPHRMIEHGLELAHAREYVRQAQERLIVSPVLEQLRIAYPRQAALEEQLRALLAQFAELSYAEQGYGPANVVTLLRLYRGELRGLDLSGLALRSVYLQGVEMQDASLAGAAIQESIFTETFDAITAVAISSTGAYWAAASRRGEIRVWDTPSAPSARSSGAASNVSSSASSRGVTLQRTWRAHADMVWALAFSPDDRTLASGSWDGTVKLWDVAAGALIWSGTHASHVNRVVFSPDGSMLASSSIDATVRIWDVRSGRLVQELAHPDPVTTVTWSPHGDLLASSDHLARIWLWDVRNLRATGHGQATHVRTIQGHTIHGHKDWVDALAFSPDQRTLASASWDGTIKLWKITPSLGGDEEGLTQTLTGHTDRVGRIAWSPDGHTLASGSRDHTIRLWDVQTTTYRAVLQGHTGSVYALAFTPDGGSLLTSSEDGTLRVWGSATGQCIRVMLGYTASLYVVDWSPDGTQLVSGGIDSLVVIYDVAGATSAGGAKPAKILRGHTGVVIGVAWSPDGRWVASSEWDNAVRLWDPNSGACLQVLSHPENSGNCFYGLAWSPCGQAEPGVQQTALRQGEPPVPAVLASGTYHYGVQVFYLTAATTRWQHWEESTFPTLIRPVAWRPDGKQLAGGGDDGTVYVWDAKEGTPPRTPVQRLSGHHSLIRSVAWSPSGARLVSSSGGTDGGELFVWDPESGERVAAFNEHSGIIYAVAWGPSDDILVSGGGDGALRWWNVQSGECLWVRQAHQGTVQSLRRSPDGTMLASCGDDGAIKIWDLCSGEYLKTVRRDRPYERLNITGIKGLTEAQISTLHALGAIEDGAVSAVPNVHTTSVS